MSLDLNSAEYLVDTISERITQLLNERDILKSELFRTSKGTMEQDKAFVKIYRDLKFVPTIIVYNRAKKRLVAIARRLIRR